MKTDTRHKLSVDSARIWNMTNNWPESKPTGFRYSCLINYVGDTRISGSLIGVTWLIFNFKSISVAEKNGYLKRYSNVKLKNRSHEPLEGAFNSPFVILAHYTSSNIVRYTHTKKNKLFVPKFYHDRKTQIFKKILNTLVKRIKLTIFQK